MATASVLLVFALLFGATWSFLNGSSQLPFYKARLARAYLGASNPRRRAQVGVSDPVRGDDIDLLAYFGSRFDKRGELESWSDTAYVRGAPLHLVNVTVNDTKGSRSQVQQQDRKGLNFVLGPCGLSIGLSQHAVFDRNATGGVCATAEARRIRLSYPRNGEGP